MPHLRSDFPYTMRPVFFQWDLPCPSLHPPRACVPYYQMAGMYLYICKPVPLAQSSGAKFNIPGGRDSQKIEDFWLFAGLWQQCAGYPDLLMPSWVRYLNGAFTKKSPFPQFQDMPLGRLINSRAPPLFSAIQPAGFCFSSHMAVNKQAKKKNREPNINCGATLPQRAHLPGKKAECEDNNSAYQPGSDKPVIA